MASTYSKVTGFATTHGQMLEVNLAALLYLRGLISGLDFQLGTNVKGAGALDDVVFRFRPPTESHTWTTLYVQLKHKAKRPVQRAMLTSPKGDFSLPKYFESYLEIRQAMFTAEKGTLFDGSIENSVFIIFTNAKASRSLKEGSRGALREADEFVWSGTGNVFSFEEDEDVLESLGECGDEGGAFLSRLRLFCGQPDAKRLEAAIKKELRNLDGEITQGVDLQSLFDCFLRRVKLWWEKSNEVLDRGVDLLLTSVLEAISQRTEKKFRLDLDFEEDVLKSVKDSVTREGTCVNILSSESSSRLSLTKLCQAFGGQALVLDSEGLLANKGVLLAQWRKGGVRSLIICANDWVSSHQVDCLHAVKDLLAIRDTPPIVFLSGGESSSVKALTGEFQESANSCEDDFLFSQLRTESRVKVLATEVSLQGHSTTLHALLKDSPGGADRVLDACSVVEILERDGGLTLGSPFGEDIDFYVDRHLEATVVKGTVFQDGALRECVTVWVMLCESLADLGLDDGDEGEPSGAPRVSATNNRAGLFDKAVSFLSSLNDSKSLHSVDTAHVVSRLSKSQLDADEVDGEVFTGPEAALGSFTCRPIGLRFGLHEAVTALWVRSSHSTQSGFLFVSDKTSENDARKLSDFHKSKHWLSLKDGQLRWIRSQGDIEAIRRHVDKDQVFTFAPGNAMDVEDRLVLVCADPGMGKSTLMARLAKEAKEAHPRHFVFLVALNDHSQLFAKGKHRDALGFLCSANKIKSHLHRSLIKYALEVSGDAVVLFDGYDEIAPKYVEQSCDLLASLVDNTKASKVWMTSRNSIKTILETKVAKFAVALRKFIEEDQISFLRKFWAAKSNLSEMELVNFTKLLVEKTAQAVRDKEKNFMGIPLQTRMLAEVYEGHVTGSADRSKLPDKLDSLKLLDQFVDKKFRVYVEAKLKISEDSPNYEDLFESVRESYMERHSYAGLILILGYDDIKTYRMQAIVTKSLKFFAEMKLGVDKTGFIDSVVNGKPRFVHRVFAEYFVANWISKHFADHRELVESKMFTADFAVVRNLFDRMLAKDHDLHTAVINEDFKEVRTLLAREDVDVDSKDSGGRTALHLAASLGTNRDRGENKRRCAILDLLIGKTSDFDQVDDVLVASPLKHAHITQSWVAVDRLILCTDNIKQLTLPSLTQESTLETILYLDLHNLLGFFLDDGLDVNMYRYQLNRTPLHLAAEFQSPGAVRVLLEALDEAGRGNAVSLEDDNGDTAFMLAAFRGCVECVRLIAKAGGKLTQVDNDERTPLMISAYHGHQEVVSFLLSSLNAERDGMSLQDYINMTQKTGRTAIHLASRYGHSQVISALIAQGGDPRSHDHFNRTPLHTAASSKHPDAVRVLLEALAEAGRADAVDLVDNDGYSVLMDAAWGGCVECVGQVVEAGGKLTQVNNDGRTPLMAAARQGHQEVVGFLLHEFDCVREGMTKLAYIQMADKIGDTALDLASSECREMLHAFIMQPVD